MNDDEQHIRELMDQWRRRTAEGDIDGVLALMTDDAIFLTCGTGVMTRSDFAALARATTDRVRVEATQDVKEIHASGDLAYAWTRISVVVTPMGGGSRIERAGHTLTVFRRSPSGTWLLARDANLVPSPKA